MHIDRHNYTLLGTQQILYPICSTGCARSSRDPNTATLTARSSTVQVGAYLLHKMTKLIYSYVYCTFVCVGMYVCV